MKKKCAILLVLIAGLPASVFAAWVPIITDTMFDGIRGDMLTAVGGILGLSLIVFGLAMIMRTTGR
jgi:hypothetical protein